MYGKSITHKAEKGQRTQPSIKTGVISGSLEEVHTLVGKGYKCMHLYQNVMSNFFYLDNGHF
jgi:hypothetical protein